MVSGDYTPSVGIGRRAFHVTHVTPSREYLTVHSGLMQSAVLLASAPRWQLTVGNPLNGKNVRGLLCCRAVRPGQITLPG
jgi:hypothetical protein